MDIGHAVWVLIFIILIMVFYDGYVGEYMVAVTEFFSKGHSQCVYLCVLQCTAQQMEIGRGEGDGCEVSGEPTVSLASDFTLG